MKNKSPLVEMFFNFANLLIEKYKARKTAKPQIEDAEYTIVETKINSPQKIQQ